MQPHIHFTQSLVNKSFATQNVPGRLDLLPQAGGKERTHDPEDG
jgi:hypothetical protein